MICWILFVLLIILYALSIIAFVVWKNNRPISVSSDNHKYYNDLLEKHKNLEIKYNDLFNAFGKMTEIAHISDVLKNSFNSSLESCKKDLENCKNNI